MKKIRYRNIMFLLVIILPFFSSVTTARAEAACRELTGWEYKWGDLPVNDTRNVWKSADALIPGKYPAGETTIWFKVKLGGGRLANPAVYCRQIYAKNLSVYLGDRKIYEKKHRTFYNTNKFITPLHPDFYGRTLYIRANQPELGELNFGQAPVVFIGNFDDLFHRFLKDNFPDLIWGGFFILLAIALFLGSVFFKVKPQKNWVTLSFILFFFGINWAIFPNNVGTFFPTLEEPLLFLVIITLSALPVLLIYFFEQIFGPGSKSFLRRLRQIQLVFSVLCVSASSVNILSQYRFNDIDFFVSNMLMGFLYLALFAVLAIVAVYYAFKGNTDAKIFTAGFAVFAGLLTVDLLIFFLINDDYSFILYKYGEVALLISLIGIAGRRVALNYDKVIKYSKELEVKNRELDSTRKEVEKSRDQLIELNKTLEQRVMERTEQLSKTNEELQEVNDELSASNEYLLSTLDMLTKTQNQLIESEKMAALGQLVAGVAHEINSPLGAIGASIENILELLNNTLIKQPPFYKTFSTEDLTKLNILLATAFQNKNEYISSNEERNYRKAWLAHLQTKAIPDPEKYADMLVTMGIYAIESHAPFLENKENVHILEMAYKLSGLQRNAKTIKIAVERTSKVVFALKSYAHFGSLSEMEEVDIRSGLETVLTLYHNKIKHGVEVVRNYADIRPIRCYPDELNQIWTNIIHNALQAMDYQGKLMIDIAKEGNYIMVAITDTGAGIPETIKDKIFDPFFTTKSQGEGSGLGLHIVKQIVDKHRGKIEVDSRPGLTTFRVFIPDDL